jgi:hypothetical protein
MGMWQGDVFFRRIIELIINDIRDNEWLLDDVLSDLVTDPMLSGVYGQKEINNAKKWLRDNEISVLLPHRMDLEKVPCITISIGSNIEDRSLARLGDLTPYVDSYNANQVGKSISYVVQPFQFVSYDQATGFIETPSSVDLAILTPGMVVVNPANGSGYVIKSINNNGIFIAENSQLTSNTVGVIPQYMIYKARREIATFQEKVTIGCHAHGDPNALLWMHSIVMYGLLRYREGAIESRNFQISNLESTDMIRNQNWEGFGENVYSRFITLSGQVENTWIKSPKRVIESVIFRDTQEVDGQTLKLSGLVIYNEDGKQVPEIIDQECEPWVSKDSED